MVCALLRVYSQFKNLVSYTVRSFLVTINMGQFLCALSEFEVEAPLCLVDVINCCMNMLIAWVRVFDDLYIYMYQLNARRMVLHRGIPSHLYQDRINPLPTLGSPCHLLLRHHHRSFYFVLVDHVHILRSSSLSMMSTSCCL